MTRHLLVFDDCPLNTENVLFRFQLRRAFARTDIEVLEERAIPDLETSLKARHYAAIILDVMAAFPDAPELEAMAGIEVLKRCRAGNYGEFNRWTLVFMRTARGELDVKELAFNLGCTGYFVVGSQDEKLIDMLVKQLDQG
jgi:CheY-like chemotaxis protein